DKSGKKGSHHTGDSGSKKSHRSHKSHQPKETQEKAEQKALVLTKPQDCRTLAQYYHHVNEKEQAYLAQKAREYMKAKLVLTPDNWLDAIELLNLRDGGVSGKWLNFVYDTWQTDLSQNDWIRAVLITTIIRLQYQQPGVLSSGGAVGLLNKMLDWIDGAEKSMGEITDGSIEGWRMVLVIMNLLALSYNQGVGGTIYKKLFDMIMKFDINLYGPVSPVRTGGLKGEYNKIQEQLDEFLKKKANGFSGKHQVEKEAKNEAAIKELEPRVVALKLKCERLEQLLAALKANRALMEINWTSLQRLNEYTNFIGNIFKAAVGTITAATTLAAGTTALVGAIAAVGPSYGGAALLLIPAIAGFSASVVGAGVSLVQSGIAGGHAGYNAYMLFRSADEHPINQMFDKKVDANKVLEKNLLNSLQEQYLENGVLRKETHGDDSWHLIQFLRELLIGLNGAAALKPELRNDVEKGISALLKAVYVAHGVDQSKLDNAICAETIVLTQMLQQY
ncbi:MAG: hypothetical protein ACK4PR_13055, partial [Gammaproteobacteria bacterium]